MQLVSLLIGKSFQKAGNETAYFLNKPTTFGAIYRSHALVHMNRRMLQKGIDVSITGDAINTTNETQKMSLEAVVGRGCIDVETYSADRRMPNAIESPTFTSSRLGRLWLRTTVVRRLRTYTGQIARRKGPVSCKLVASQGASFYRSLHSRRRWTDTHAHFMIIMVPNSVCIDPMHRQRYHIRAFFHGVRVRDRLR